MFTSGESCYVFLCACLRRCRDEAHEVPKAFYKKCAEAGILGAACGDWPTTFAGPSPLENWDAIHAQIMIDELCRCASGGLVWGIVGGLGIGLPPVLHFASAELQARVAPGCLAGEKFICLAITEPYAGSDVAALRTTAVKDPSGKFYIVNGEKKARGNELCFHTVRPYASAPFLSGSRTACSPITSQSQCVQVARAPTASACCSSSAPPV